MDRCYNKDCVAYPNYGGRGICVYPAWHDVSVFVADLPAGYVKGLEIDRIDNDGHYEPGNIKWSTRAENTDNRRTGHKIAFDGKVQSAQRWAEETGIGVGTLYTRIRELGWSAEKALTTPPLTALECMACAYTRRWQGHERKSKPNSRVLKTFQHEGRMKTIAELAADTGVSEKLLRKRICERGWSVEKAVINIQE